MRYFKILLVLIDSTTCTNFMIVYGKFHGLSFEIFRFVKNGVRTFDWTVLYVHFWNGGDHWCLGDDQSHYFSSKFDLK